MSDSLGIHMLLPLSPIHLAERLAAVLTLHSCRQRDGDGFTIRWCRECGQNWPCPTVLAAGPETVA